MMTGNTKPSQRQTSCRQCGICCTKGGAALHFEDLALLLENKISRSSCVTLRKGEFAFNPVKDQAEPIKSDIIKLRGSGGEWVCCFFDAALNNCGIYKYRPSACRILRCWEPEKSLAIIGKDLLTREMIVEDEEKLLGLIKEYEERFPLPDFSSLASNLTAVEDLVNRDLRFRDKLIKDSVEIATDELFLFGRPIFQLLQPFGVSVFEKENHLCLRMG